jgi:predicted metalloprotease with PDZ domain
MNARFLPCVAFALAALAALLPHAASAQEQPLLLAVDASQGPQKIYHVHETLPVRPGPFTFVYPKWYPGFHEAVGSLPGFVALHVGANGSELPWRRDLVDFYAIHVDVPPGAAAIDVRFDLVDAPASIGDQEPANTANLLIVLWQSLLVYPQGSATDDVPVRATLTLPQGWDFATALPLHGRDGATASFETVSLSTLADSPLLSGRYFRKVALSGEPPAELDLAADSAAALAIPDATVAGMRRLVAEAPAMYGSRHWRTYHFLLALTDSVAGDGIEHHESSDNRAPESYLTDDEAFKSSPDLLAHEFSHSWNGKYRRPYDLWTRDFQEPEKTDLLWVYEGMNQYLGEVLATRSRLLKVSDERDNLAMTAAGLDNEGGRLWRPLRDVADEAPILYSSPPAWAALRRTSTDFYTEGDLIWLEADTIIRRESHGARSLDDFLKRFASGGTTTPSVKTYTVDDVIATLQDTQPYDWRGFFEQRIAKVQPHPPLGGLENAGWRLAYGTDQSDMWKAYEAGAKIVDVRYSVGITVSTNDGTIADVLPDSPAAVAGIAPNTKLLAVNGRKWSADGLHDAIAAAARSHEPIELLVTNGDFFTTARVAAYGGNRYPHLERIAGTQDLLERIYTPRTFAPKE